jgi:hypothetical protein
VTAGAEPDVIPAAIRRPQPRTPARTPGSIRRASHIGVHWPSETVDIARSELIVHGAVRDLVTDTTGRGHVAGEAGLDCSVAPDRSITAITATPDDPALHSLVGRIARGGWRAAARELVGTDALLSTVLDDVPIAVMLSSYGALRQGALDAATVRPLMVHMRDLCAGWADDATPMRTIDAGQALPLPGVVPVPEGDGIDALATEPRLAMVPGEVRRTRRLDVMPAPEVVVHASFRDTWCDPAGAEGVLHEYDLVATLTADHVVASVSAEPRVLPYDECSLAAGSPGRLVGRHIEDVAAEVRATAGRATCTHLDDLLRSLVAVPSLLRRITAGDVG